MRFNVLVLVPTVVALASYVQGHYDEFATREAREIQSLLRRSEIMEELAEISTRDLIDELSSRLEARTMYPCSKCGRNWKSGESAESCFDSHKSHK